MMELTMYDWVAIVTSTLCAVASGRIVYNILNDGRVTYWLASRAVLYGRNHVLISGPAGSGKTQLIKYLISKKPNTVVVAPTGLAAHTVGGVTIHSFFGFPWNQALVPNSITTGSLGRKNFKNFDTLVIDEISMVRVDLLDAIDRTLRIKLNKSELPFGGVRVILIGDVFQLPPILGDDTPILDQHYPGGHFFNAPVFADLNFDFFDLKKIFRQRDKKFQAALNEIRHGDASQKTLENVNTRVASEAVVEGTTHLTIVFTNKKADAVNSRKLSELKGETLITKTVNDGDVNSSDAPCEGQLVLKEGAQVVFIQNNVDNRWVNGTLGTIVKIGPEKVEVKLLTGAVLEVRKYVWQIYKYTDNEVSTERVIAGTITQYPFKLAWAITAHKSQGQTFDRVHLDISDSNAFADGQTYVAISRCRKLEDMTLSREIRRSEVRVDQKCFEFIEGLKARSSAG